MRRSNGQQSWVACPLLLTEFRRIGVSAGSGRSPDAGETPGREGIPATQKSRGGRFGAPRQVLRFVISASCRLPPELGAELETRACYASSVTRDPCHSSPGARHLVHVTLHLVPDTRHPAFSPKHSTPLTPSRNPPAAGTVRSGESRCRRVQRHRGRRSRVRRGAGSR